MAGQLVSVALAGLLTFVIYDDLRNYQIRNEVIGVILALFVLDAFLLGMPRETLAHVLFGAIMFALLVALYAAGAMGGGDAKLLTVAMLWMGVEKAVQFSLFLFVATLAYTLGAKLGWFPSREKSARIWIPFGPAIATAWLLTIVPWPGAEVISRVCERCAFGH